MPFPLLRYFLNQTCTAPTTLRLTLTVILTLLLSHALSHLLPLFLTPCPYPLLRYFLNQTRTTSTTPVALLLSFALSRLLALISTLVPYPCLLPLSLTPFSLPPSFRYLLDQTRTASAALRLRHPSRFCLLDVRIDLYFQ